MEAMPIATWRGGAEVVETEDTSTITKFEEAIDKLAIKLLVWPTMSRADILAGLGRYAGLLLGAKGEISAPLGRLGPDGIYYLSAYAEDELVIVQFDEDSASPRFGLPETYRLMRSTMQSAGTVSQGAALPPRIDKDVHFERIVHFADKILDDRVFGVPRLERVWDKLDDLDKVTGGGAEAFWQRANQGLQFDIDKDALFTEAEAEAMKTEVEHYMHRMQRSIRTRGVRINPLGGETADFLDNTEAILVQIAAGSGVPRRILTGSESGELASTQDRSNWNDRVMDRRREVAEPVIRAFVDRMVAAGVIPAPKEYHVRWPRQEELTELEKTEAVQALTGANKAMAESTGEVIMTGDEIRDRYFLLGPITDEQRAKIVTPVDMAREEAERNAEMAEKIAKGQAAGPDPGDEDDGPGRTAVDAKAASARRVRAEVVRTFAEAVARIPADELATAMMDGRLRSVQAVVQDALTVARQG
jgi:hypothetical protein